MYFCPNCSAMLSDPNAPSCPKCGFDRIAAKIEEERERAKRLDAGQEVEAPYGASPMISGSHDAKTECPICKTGLAKIMDSQISFDLLGKEVKIHNIRIMGMNLHKRAITQCIVTFDGYVCEQNHKFFTRYTQSYRELCPICRDTMRKFGKEVRTCSRCHINISGLHYLKMDGQNLLEDEGWSYEPRLLDDN